MDKLLVAAKICDVKKVIAVPMKYVYKFDIAKGLNNRINRNQVHLCFWSSDPEKEPRFDLPISNRFDRQVDSCFKVKLLKVFGNQMFKFRIIRIFGFSS